MEAYSDSSTARASSRFRRGNSRTRPLWTHSQRPWRKGWQFVCWTAVPVEARMWARNNGELTWPATSRRLRSCHAGSMLLKTAGVSASEPYQPTPKPSLLVVEQFLDQDAMFTLATVRETIHDRRNPFGSGVEREKTRSVIQPVKAVERRQVGRLGGPWPDGLVAGNRAPSELRWACGSR